MFEISNWYEYLGSLLGYKVFDMVLSKRRVGYPKTLSGPPFLVAGWVGQTSKYQCVV
jgi:hypothetical protein